MSHTGRCILYNTSAITEGGGGGGGGGNDVDANYVLRSCDVIT